MQSGHQQSICNQQSSETNTDKKIAAHGRIKRMENTRADRKIAAHERMNNKWQIQVKQKRETTKMKKDKNHVGDKSKWDKKRSDRYEKRQIQYADKTKSKKKEKKERSGGRSNWRRIKWTWVDPPFWVSDSEMSMEKREKINGRWIMYHTRAACATPRWSYYLR